MHTLVCKKRPKAAEGLLGQTSWCEGGRGGVVRGWAGRGQEGRRAGPREVRPGDSEASPAAPSPGSLGARHLGRVDTDQPGESAQAFFQPDARLPSIGQNAFQLCWTAG